jgi:hypothetical protein
MKMPSKLKKDWVAALRSGEYQQAKGRLCKVGEFTGTGYCCLGVLEMVAEGEVEKEPIAMFVPSDEFYKRNGIDFGLVGVDAGMLAAKNDTGTSFIEIADFIERNVEEIE